MHLAPVTILVIEESEKATNFDISIPHLQTGNKE